MQTRPLCLAEIAARADSLARFDRELAEWLHTVRALGSRPAPAATIAEAPSPLADRFSEGALADATLAAYADLLAARIGAAPPAWALAPGRILPEPWFAVDGPRGRLLALRDSPPAFQNRNLFSPSPDLPIRLHARRPPVSAEKKRRATNAARQRRFQKKRREHLRHLEAALAHARGSVDADHPSNSRLDTPGGHT
jgi:hypothetical protein